MPEAGPTEMLRISGLHAFYGESHILHGMMIVDLDVALRLDIQINEAVSGTQGQHVIKKRNAGPDGGSAFAVE